MVTDDEIDQRINDKDAPRSARRSATAKQIAGLAQRHAILAAQLSDIERELGDVLVASQDVIDVTELHEFTDVPTADLTRWFTARATAKNTRAKRKRSATTPSTADSGRHQETPTAGKPTADPSAQTTRSEPNAQHARVPAEIG